MNIYQICSPITVLSSFCLGFFVYFNNRKSAVNRMWFFTSIAVSVWALGFFLYFALPVSYGAGLVAARASSISAIFIAAFFIHFALVFVGRKPSKNKILLLSYVIVVFILCIGSTSFFIPYVEKVGDFYQVRPGQFYGIFTTAFLLLILYSQYVLIKGLKDASPLKRNQIKYISISTSAAFICGATTFFPVYKINISPILANFVFIYTFIVSYAILKHRLMDINVVIRRSLVYSILIALITSIYLVFILLIERFFQGLMGYRSVITSILAAFLIALFFNPIRNKIQHFVDKYFFKGSQEALQRENERLMLELERSERLKSVATLAAGMAHEIKNPLSAIKTFTEYLPQKYDQPDFRDKFTRIVGFEVEKIDKIVRDLLDFAKPKPIQLQQTDINSILEDTANLLSSDLLKHNIKLIKDLDPKIPQIQADANKLKQAFLNLMLNSIDAIDKQGTITLKTQLNDQQIQITIQDTGKGISQKDIPRIFDPFFSTKEHGTGLGLSIVHGIIREHNGAIEVESKPGQGTSFTIKLGRQLA